MEATNSTGMRGALNSREPLIPTPTFAWQEAAQKRPELFLDRWTEHLQPEGCRAKQEIRSQGVGAKTIQPTLFLYLAPQSLFMGLSWIEKVRKILFWRC